VDGWAENYYLTKCGNIITYMYYSRFHKSHFFGDFVHFPAKWLRSQKKTRKQDLSHFGKSHPHGCRFVPENLNLILSGNLSRLDVTRDLA
jgi:hypothetical protein